jgi:hypothetical protein
MKYTTDTLAALSLKELAALVGKPSLTKYSKAKAVAYVLKHLPAAPAPKAKKAAAEDKAPRVSKHDTLLEALRDGGTREALMEASGFDNKNLSVAMCNLKGKGYVIKCEMVDLPSGIFEEDVELVIPARFYTLVE